MSRILLFLIHFLLNIRAEITFKHFTNWKIIAEDSTAICSVTDFVDGNKQKYWIEYNANRSTEYDAKNTRYSNIYSTVYETRSHKLNSLSNFTLTNIGYTSLQNTTSLPFTCTNPITNNIFTSYSIGYHRINKTYIIQNHTINNAISSFISIYYKIFDINTRQFTSQYLAFNGLIQPYHNKPYSNWNYNFNSKPLCNDNWYLLSWFHWDQYQAYLLYKIVYKDDNDNYIQSPIIYPPINSIIYNISLYVAQLPKTKCIQSKSNKSIFLSVYDDYDKETAMLRPNITVEYAQTCKAIIGQVYKQNNGSYNINFITKEPFIINQNTNKHVFGFSTGLLKSDYVLVHNNPSNTDCCFVILYTESYFKEPSGICTIYMSVFNDIGVRVMNDTKVYTIPSSCTNPKRKPYQNGIFGGIQVIELDMLRTMNESYFMVTFSINFPVYSYLNGYVYKLYYNDDQTHYEIDSIDCDSSLPEHHFYHYKHTQKSNAKLIMDVCLHINQNSSKLFVGYTLNDVRMDQTINYSYIKQPIRAAIYNVLPNDSIPTTTTTTSTTTTTITTTQKPTTKKNDDMMEHAYIVGIPTLVLVIMASALCVYKVSTKNSAAVAKPDKNDGLLSTEYH